MPLDPEMTVYNTVTITTGQKISSILCKKHYKNIAIFLPANYTAGYIKFKGSHLPTTGFVPILKGSTGLALVTANLTLSNCVIFDDIELRSLFSVPYIQLEAENTQVEANNIIITIVMTR